MNHATLYKNGGPLRSTVGSSLADKTTADCYFQHREKADVALTVGTSWYGGDYFEFGSHDLNTFRNMLSAYDLCGMTRNYDDVRFYAFDIFGKVDERADQGFKDYVAAYTKNGCRLAEHERYIADHGLYPDRCHLVQGLFADTLTPERRDAYMAEGRKIGFAFLDCNIGPSYKTVFEWIFPMLGEHSYIYMDEYLQNPDVIAQFEQFTAALRKKRNMGAVWVRNAAGFGGLFRLHPISTAELDL